MSEYRLPTIDMELNTWETPPTPSNNTSRRDTDSVHSCDGAVTPKTRLSKNQNDQLFETAHSGLESSSSYHGINDSSAQHVGPVTGNKPGFLRRELKRLDIFMIAISNIIGMGFYVKTGTILGIGGSGAVIYSFILLGSLALIIMRNLTTLLRIWPVAGALIVFVESFVDEEVGKSVAFLYWLTYCFVFAGLTTTIGGLLEYSLYHISTGSSVAISIISLAVPILCNLTPITIFRRIELLFGFIKLALAISIIIIMNVINPIVSKKGPAASTGQHFDLKNETSVFSFAPGATGGWFSAIMASIFLASFAFIGIEVVGATAHEAKFKSGAEPEASRAQSIEAATDEEASLSGSTHRPSTPEDIASNPFEYATLAPLVATAIYVWGGWIVSQNVYWQDNRLPKLASNSTTEPYVEVSSPFVTSAEDFSDTSHSLPRALMALLIVNVISTSSTALYVGSRTLFGFSYSINQGYNPKYSTWWLSIVRILSRKNKCDVPYVAVLTSAWLFWVPFLRYSPSLRHPGSHNFAAIVDVITQMASVSCIIVWAIETFAALRFYLCFKRHYKTGVLSGYKNIEAILKTNSTEFLLRLVMCSIAIILCVLIIIVGGTMTYVISKDPLQAVAAFPMIGVFIVFTCLLKLVRYLTTDDGWPWFVDLKDEKAVKTIFQNLDDQIKHNSEGF